MQIDTPTPRSTQDIYLIAAHSHWRESRVNLPLRNAAAQLKRVHLCDLYARYPDYDIDVQAEQNHLAAAQLVVLMHPIQWYAMPALLKLWVDEVLTYGWAYGGGTALHGKDLWLALTTGGPQSAYQPSGYNRYPFDAFLPPYEQTAALCGMRFLPPLVLHGAHSAAQHGIEQHVRTFTERLRSYPDWPALKSLPPRPAHAVPSTDRPETP
jgi:glutathione-regulated potassium-efflux system ancillary protein KefF